MKKSGAVPRRVYRPSKKREGGNRIIENDEFCELQTDEEEESIEVSSNQSKSTKQILVGLIAAVVFLAIAFASLLYVYAITDSKLMEYSNAAANAKLLAGRTVSSTSRNETANIVFLKFLKAGARPGRPDKSDYQIVVRAGKMPTLYIKDGFGNVILVGNLTDSEISDAVDERIKALALTKKGI